MMSLLALVADAAFRRRVAAALLGAGCAVLLVSVGGCNVAGPIYAFAEGPPTVEAQYVLPEESRVVVFIDDRANRLPRARLRTTIASRTTDLLFAEKQVVAEAIDPASAARLAAAEDLAGSLKSIDEIGRDVGADVVIYAVIDRFSLAEEGVPRPVCVMRVKVIDVETGERLFPSDERGRPVVARMGFKSASAYDADRLRTLDTTLAEFAGMRLAELFYEHEVNPLDGRLTD